MEKLLSSLILFSINSFWTVNLIACSCLIKVNDHTNKTVKDKRSNLEQAKAFLTKTITITDVLPGKTIKTYLDHIKKVNQNNIASNINFIFDDSYHTTILNQQEIDLTLLLEENKIIEPVWFKLKLLEKDLIINNILNQASAKILSQPISGLTALATNKITSKIVKNKIIKLIENRIDNNDVKVDWSSQSTLTSLRLQQENKGKVELSIKNEQILQSKTVDFVIIDVSESEIKVNQQLIKKAVSKIQQIDVQQENIQNSVNLSDIEFKHKIENIITTIIDNPKIKVTLKASNTTLKQQNNQLSITLSIGIDDQRFEIDDITILLLNVLSDEKMKNQLILNQLKQQLGLVDGSNLRLDFLLKNEKIRNVITQQIQSIITSDDYTKITNFNIFPVYNSSSLVTLQSTKCNVNIFLTIGKEKNQVMGLISLHFDNVKS